MRIHGADAVRELVHAELAEKYRPGLAELAHHGRVVLGDPVLEDA